MLRALFLTQSPTTNLYVHKKPIVYFERWIQLKAKHQIHSQKNASKIYKMMMILVAYLVWYHLVWYQYTCIGAP